MWRWRPGLRGQGLSVGRARAWDRALARHCRAAAWRAWAAAAHLDASSRAEDRRLQLRTAVPHLQLQIPQL